MAIPMGEKSLLVVRPATDYASVAPPSPSPRPASALGPSRHAEEQKLRQQLVLSAAMALVFSLIVLIGGIGVGSLAVVMNGAQLLTNFALFVLLIFLQLAAQKRVTRLGAFRKYRDGLMVAIVILLVVWFVSGGVVIVGILRILKGSSLVLELGMLVAATLAVPFNLLVLFTLRHMAHQCHNVRNLRPITPLTNDISVQQRTLILSRTMQHLELRVPFLHLVVGASECLLNFVVAVICYFKHTAAITDVVLSLVYVALAVASTLAIFYQCVQILSEGVLVGLDFTEIADSLLSIDGVTGVKQLRIWSLTLDKVSLSVELSISPAYDTKGVWWQANTILKEIFQIYEFTIMLDKDIQQGRSEGFDNSHYAFIALS